jgi:hypothetical protein
LYSQKSPLTSTKKKSIENVTRFLPLLRPLVVKPAEVEFNDGIVEVFTLFEAVIIVPGYGDGSFVGLVDKHPN